MFRFSKFLGIISWSAGGSVVTLACMPLLTRIYEPAGFGLLGVVQAAASVIAPFVTGRYEQALLLGRGDRMMKGLLWLCVLILFLTGLTLFLFASIYANLDGGIGDYAYFVPAFALAIALYSLTEKCFLRFGLENWIGRQSFLRGTAASIFPLIGWYIFSKDSRWLLALTLAGNAFPVIVSYFVLRKHFRKKNGNLVFPGWKEIFIAGKTYINLPKFNAVHASFNSMTLSSPQLLIAHSFGLEAAGLFSIANRLIYAPVSLVNQASGAINSKIIAANRVKHGSSDLLKTVLVRASVFSLIIIISVWLMGNKISALLGQKWNEIPTYLLLLCPSMFTSLAAGSLAYLPIAYRKQKEALLLEMASLTVRMSALMVGTRFGSIYWALGMFAFASVFLAGATHLWYHDILKRTHEG